MVQVRHVRSGNSDRIWHIVLHVPDVHGTICRWSHLLLVPDICSRYDAVVLELIIGISEHREISQGQKTKKEIAVSKINPGEKSLLTFLLFLR